MELHDGNLTAWVATEKAHPNAMSHNPNGAGRPSPWAANEEKTLTEILNG